MITPLVHRIGCVVSQTTGAALRDKKCSSCECQHYNTASFRGQHSYASQCGRVSVSPSVPSIDSGGGQEVCCWGRAQFKGQISIDSCCCCATGGPRKFSFDYKEFQHTCWQAYSVQEKDRPTVLFPSFLFRHVVQKIWSGVVGKYRSVNNYLDLL